MPLTRPEKTWLKAYSKALQQMHRPAVERLVLFGSKARGDDHPDSDVDVLVIVRNDAAPLKRKVRRIGYELAATGELVPSILVYTEAEWRSRKESGSPLRRAIEREGVRVL
jgi:predicted nucleotidyltransferase